MRSVYHLPPRYVPQLEAHVRSIACFAVRALAQDTMLAELGGRATRFLRDTDDAVVQGRDGALTPLLGKFLPRAAAVIGSQTCDCIQCTAVRGDRLKDIR